MSVTASRIKEIKTEFSKLRPAKITLDGSRVMTVKEAIFALAPTPERMKKRGFDMQAIVEKLHEKGIEVKAQTLARYLNEFRRGKECRKKGKRDASPRHLITAKAVPTNRIAQNEGNYTSFIVPDIPLDEL